MLPSKKFFILVMVLLLFSGIFVTKNFACIGGLTLDALSGGMPLPPEIQRNAKLSDSFSAGGSLGVFRFTWGKDHCDIFIDHKNSEIPAIRAYIDSEWKFWEYNQRGAPQPCSEERFFEMIELLRNRK